VTGRILVVEHQRDAGADVLGDRLVAAGLELTTLEIDREGALADLDAFDGLLVLGGDVNAWQEDEYPWLVEEKAAIRAWVGGRPRPLLGICLGHQLLADALGGVVGPRPTPEAGVHPVRLTADGGDDPLLGATGPVLPALQWHGAEVARAPGGAVVLATDDHAAVQAMRVGPTAWGLQFHPEVGRERAVGWGSDPAFRALLTEGAGPGAVDRYPDTLAAAADDMDRVTGRLAAAFAEQVRVYR
jgi:GMP synthase-like glutamine amidotransferase